MKLNHLYHTECPCCKARVVYEEQRSQHCNGEWFEGQRFHCGGMVEWSPNFSKEEVRTQCPFDPATKERDLKRIAALNKLEQVIDNLDVDAEFKKEVWASIPYHLKALETWRRRLQ